MPWPTTRLTAKSSYLGAMTVVILARVTATTRGFGTGTIGWRRLQQITRQRAGTTRWPTMRLADRWFYSAAMAGPIATTPGFGMAQIGHRRAQRIARQIAPGLRWPMTAPDSRWCYSEALTA